MNGIEIAREEAATLELDYTDGHLGWHMWNDTGWPSFFQGDPETTYREQMREALHECVGEEPS